MFNEVNQEKNFNETAFARFEERMRIIRVVKEILVKFPEQFPSRKRYRIAKEVCNILYKEIDDKFGML